MRRLLGVFTSVALVFIAPITAKAQSYSWSGFYIGGHAGYSWADANYTFTNVIGSENFGHDMGGGMGGAHVGIQQQWSNVVAGVEVSWSAVDLSDRRTSVLQPGRLRQIEIDSLFTVTGRLGLVLNDWLLYAKGGYASADVDTFAINPATGVSGSTSGRESGWIIGAGLEKALMPNLILGAEYNFVQLNVGSRSAIATDGTTFSYSGTDAEVHTLMARLSYKFGWQGSHPHQPMK